MPDINKYCSPQNIYKGIMRYVSDHAELYQDMSYDQADPDSVAKMLRKIAGQVLPQKDYDTFRKAITSLCNGKTYTLKSDNLYRLCFVMRLPSDTDAHDLFMNYLHLNELSARSLPEFILITALKLQLDYNDFGEMLDEFSNSIDQQPVSPTQLAEGQTADVYYRIINDRIHSKDDLLAYLRDPENLVFFARTRNTQYLALFDDVELDKVYNANNEQVIKLVTNYGTSERETMDHYYRSLFGLQTADSDETLDEKEINALIKTFDNVFMSYDNFCELVQRKRPVDVSSGIFLLNLLKNLLTEDGDQDMDFYVDFSDPEDFTGVVNDILIYWGFPVLNPECSSFDSLIMDVYQETLDENPDADNPELQTIFLNKLRGCLKEIASK